MKERIIWVLWPAFITAAVTEMLFFAFIDPGEIHLFGNPLELSKTGAYSLFFFFFWVMGACASALTCFLQRSPFELNRCPLDAGGRPPGCPKRLGGACAIDQG
ncbi:MAG: hypothetical protein IT531_11215 [Burkholderiales bacterium]|nr:hypothetical protein [Burkholderiales bacterium]